MASEDQGGLLQGPLLLLRRKETVHLEVTASPALSFPWHPLWLPWIRSRPREFLPGSQCLYLQETGAGWRDALAAPAKALRGLRSTATAPGAQRAGRCLGAAVWGLGELQGSAPAATSPPVCLVVPRDLRCLLTLSHRRTKDETPGDVGLPLTLVVRVWLEHSACVRGHEACSAGSLRIKEPKRVADLES